MSTTRRLGGLMLGLACCGCAAETATVDPPVPVAGEKSGPASDKAAPTVTDANAGTKPFDGAATETLELEGFEFTRPAGWTQVELSDFQRGILAAKLRVPNDVQDLDLTVSFAGGGVQANVDRWIGQFRLAEGEEPRTETIRVDGRDGTWVDLRGTFSAGVGPSAGPQENWRMLGAALPHPSRDVYVKIVGPRDAVAAVHDAVRDFVRSGRYRK